MDTKTYCILLIILFSHLVCKKVLKIKVIEFKITFYK